MNLFFTKELKLSDKSLSVLESLNVVDPFPVQERAFSAFEKGGNFIISSPTGSGKTLAFLLPLLEKISRGDQVVILAPSVEIVMQINDLLKRFLDEPTICLALPVGGNPARQAEMLRKRKPTCIIGSLSRVVEHMKSKRLKLSSGAFVVLDEVDQLLAENSNGGLKTFFSLLPKGFGCVGFSASATDAHAVSLTEVSGLNYDFEEVLFEGAGNIAHEFMVVPSDKRQIALVKLLRREKLDRVLVFVNTLGNSTFLFSKLEQEGISVACVSSIRDKRDRKKAVKKFQAGEIKVLIATDALMRGLDVTDVTVVHYDVARDSEVYLHRAGRSGRAGGDGRSLTIVSPKESFLMKKYSKALGVEIQKIGDDRAGQKPGAKKAKDRLKKK